MLFRVLGDIGKVGVAPEVAISGAHKRRALLALLVLHAPRAVHRSEILESLWADKLPDHPEAALQVAVSRLRTELGTYGDHVVTEGSGYRLDVDPHEVDLHCAEALLRDGRTALANNDPATAGELFERALALWTGSPLEEFEESTYFRDARARLTELRYALVEARNDAYLLDGRHLEVLADVERWLSGEPYREHLRAQQVASLYRAGRQVDAIRRCETFRCLLRDDFGLDPSPAMRDLERRILNHDPTLLATGAGFMTTLPAWTGEVLPFIGRDAEREIVLERLMDATREGMRVVLVEGPPGSGKSRFLLEIARQIGSDAVVVALHARGVFHSPLRELARVLAEALQTVSDEELGIILETFPDIPPDIFAVREAVSALAGGELLEELIPEEEIKRFAAPWIASISAKAPVVFVIDDLETIGTSLLDVIGQLGSLPMPKRVMVLASVRGEFETTHPHLTKLVSDFYAMGLAERIALPRLSTDDIDDLLDRMKVAPRGHLVDRLHLLTGGNPLMLAELLSTGPAERVIDDWVSPPRVRDVVRRRTAELGRPTAELLKHAAIFESDFTVELLAEVADASVATVRDLVDRAVGAHVLQPSTVNSYRFAHPLFRQSLVADLSAAKRAAGHRRVAIALERAGTSAATLAGHWIAADGEDVAANITRHAIAAGRDAMHLFEPHAAVRWFELALASLPDERDRGSLLADLAEAQQFAGDPRDLSTLREAVEIAVATQDDALTMHVVRVTTPGWSSHPGITGPDSKQLLARALELANDDATRSRILARIAVEENFLDEAAGDRTCDVALALARRCGDETVLMEALHRRASLANSPHTILARREALCELLKLTLGSNNIALRYFALSTDVVAAIQAGDMGQAETSREEAVLIAAQYDLSPVRLSAMQREVWWYALAGDMERAREQIDVACAFGSAHGAAHAPDLALLQLGLLGWQEDDPGIALPAARTAHEGFARSFSGVSLMFARFLADDPAERETVEALLSKFAATDFEHLPKRSFWASGLVLTAETARILDLPEVSSSIRNLLVPFVDQIAFSGIWVTAPIAYGVAVAAAGCGDSRAGEYFDQAVALAEAIRAPHLVARINRGRARFG